MPGLFTPFSDTLHSEIDNWQRVEGNRYQLNAARQAQRLAMEDEVRRRELGAAALRYDQTIPDAPQQAGLVTPENVDFSGVRRPSTAAVTIPPVDAANAAAEAAAPVTSAPSSGSSSSVTMPPADWAMGSLDVELALQPSQMSPTQRVIYDRYLRTKEVHDRSPNVSRGMEDRLNVDTENAIQAGILRRRNTRQAAPAAPVRNTRPKTYTNAAAPAVTPTAAPVASGNATADDVFEALIQHESGGRAGVTGPATRYGNAYGMTQVLDSTGEGVARNLGIEWRPDLMRGTSEEAAAYQRRIGRAYFDEALAATNGDVRAALRYYNGGPRAANAVDDSTELGRQTNEYADAVLNRVRGGVASARNGVPSFDTEAPRVYDLIRNNPTNPPTSARSRALANLHRDMFRINAQYGNIEGAMEALPQWMASDIAANTVDAYHAVNQWRQYQNVTNLSELLTRNNGVPTSIVQDPQTGLWVRVQQRNGRWAAVDTPLTEDQMENSLLVEISEEARRAAREANQAMAAHYAEASIDNAFRMAQIETQGSQEYRVALLNQMGEHERALVTAQIQREVDAGRATVTADPDGGVFITMPPGPDGMPRVFRADRSMVDSPNAGDGQGFLWFRNETPQIEVFQMDQATVLGAPRG